MVLFKEPHELTVRAKSIIPVLLIVIASLGAAGRAHAADDSSPGDAAIEEQLKQGIALRRSGSDEAALGVFLDLEKRAPDSVRVLLHITTAAQATGKWLMAYEYLQKAANHKDDPYYQRHKAAIDNVDKTIAQRVGQFRVRGSPAGAEVRLSGEVVGTLPMNNLKAIEVGSYVLEVYKQGYYPLRRQVTIAGGGSVTQEAVDLRERKPSLAAAAGGGQMTADGSPAPDTGVPVNMSWVRARWVTWTLASVGVAAAATSGIAFAIRERDADHWNDDHRCLDSVNRFRTREDVCRGLHNELKLAEGIGIAAGIGAVTFGTAALIHGLATSHDRPSDSASVPPSGCSPGLGSIVCYGSF